MFDAKKNAEIVTASQAARREIAEQMQRYRFKGRFAEIASKRLARSIARATDLYDDCYDLLVHSRLTSAIVVARALFEQIGHAALIAEKAREIVHLDVLEGCLLDIDNASEMRKRIFRGQFDPKQMHTEDALARYGSETPAISPREYVQGFQNALNTLGDEEGKARLVYSQLCEHSHPTLFSVVHAYNKGVPSTPTSVGMLSNDDVRRGLVSWTLAQIMVLHWLWGQHTSEADANESRP
jgi:hypothetical protein